MEINEIEWAKIYRINESKSCFLDKFNKTDKCLAWLIKKDKRGLGEKKHKEYSLPPE